MIAPKVTRRLVFHIGGYDPITPPGAAHSRFIRELKRFERVWFVACSVSAAKFSQDTMSWDVRTDGQNWRVAADYRVIRWDDVITALDRQPAWRRIPLGMWAFLDFLTAGALRGYLRTNWHYALFFLYPFAVFALLAILATALGTFACHMGMSIAAGSSVGCAAFVLLLLGPWRWLHLAPLFDDWIFSRAYVRGSNLVLEQRLSRIAAQMSEAARQVCADEILIVGHSLGAVLAIDLIDRALALDPSFGTKGPRVAFISVGSSILKIGLHRAAHRFRAAVQRVASAPGVFWGEYQARIDIMNFYNTDPIAQMALSSPRGPLVRLVEISRMLERVVYRRIRLKFFRIHCQFVSGNDRRAAYDYFMLVCGPLSAEAQTVSPDGALSMINDRGVLESRFLTNCPSDELQGAQL